MAAIELKTPAEIARMRRAGAILAMALRLVEQMVRPGVTTHELDGAAEQFIEKQGGRPAFKGYRGFPASICASINEQVVHGIPDGRKLAVGDLLKVDCGVVLEGFYADAAVTIPVGRITQEAATLVQTTRRALHAGIDVVRPGVRVSEIAAAVQRVAQERGYGIVTDYTGHGIGRALHEDPKVPNFVPAGLVFDDVVLEEGATVAIEPMLNLGTHRTRVLKNGWTVVTRDGKLSAHFEHTIAVCRDGPQVLTFAADAG